MTLPDLIRKITLYVFPTEGSAGLISENTAIKIHSDGSRDTVAMSFTCAAHHQLFGKPPAAMIQIRNLSAETRNILVRASAKISLRVQYGEEPEWEIFNGGIVSSTTSRENTDFVTKVMCLPFLSEYVATPICFSYSGGMELKHVVIDIAKRLSGLTVDRVNVTIPEGIYIQRGGMVLSGSVIECLKKLARQYGFTYWIANNVFFAHMDGKTSDKNFLISYRTGNLISATPILEGVYQLQRGVKIRSMLFPGVSPGDKVTVESKTNSYVNGTFLIHTITYSGSTVSNEWYMDITSMPTMPDLFYNTQTLF